MLTEDKRGASRRVALLRVRIGEDPALLCQAIDVWRPVTHNSVVVGADVVVTDVIAPNDEDVGLLPLRKSCGSHCQDQNAENYRQWKAHSALTLHKTASSFSPAGKKCG